MLRKACRADIPKFCQTILNKASEDSELEGQVIACLKLKYTDQVSPPRRAVHRKFCSVLTRYIVCFLNGLSVQRLSPDCEDQIRVILQESALDYRLDPQLQMHCSDEVRSASGSGVSFGSDLLLSLSFLLQIHRLCAEEAAAQEQTGQVEECLKVNLLKVKQDACKKVQQQHPLSIGPYIYIYIFIYLYIYLYSTIYTFKATRSLR